MLLAMPPAAASTAIIQYDDTMAKSAMEAASRAMPPISIRRPPRRSTRNPAGVWKAPERKKKTVTSAPSAA